MIKYKIEEYYSPEAKKIEFTAYQVEASYILNLIMLNPVETVIGTYDTLDEAKIEIEADRLEQSKIRIAEKTHWVD